VSYIDEAEGSSSLLSGNYLVNASFRGQAVFPEFKSRTLFRPFGPPTADMKQIVPTRCQNADGTLSARPKDYSSWITAKQLVKGVGTSEWATFLLNQVDENGNYLPRQQHKTPYDILYKTWKAMCARDDKLKQLGVGSNEKRAAIQPIKTFAMIQGALAEHRGKQINPPILPTILVLSWSAKGSLETLMEIETDTFRALSPEQKQQFASDVKSRFASWDILNYDTGKYLLFYGNKSGAVVSSPAAVDWSGQQSYTPNGESQELSKYLVKPVDCPPLPRDASGQMLFATQGRLFTPWEKVLRFLSNEEMADILVGAFRDQPTLLIESFSAYGWLPASLARGQMISIPTGGPVVGPALGAVGGMPAGIPGMMVHPPGMVTPPASTAPAKDDIPMNWAPSTPPPAAPVAPQPPVSGPDWGAAATSTPEDNAKRLAAAEGQVQPQVPVTPPPSALPGSVTPDEVAKVMAHLKQLHQT
jgi:hypothetical protein